MVLKRVPLEDLQTRRELGIALIAEQPTQVAEKEPCEVILRILVDQSSIQLDSLYSECKTYMKPFIEKKEAAVRDGVLHDSFADSALEGDALLGDVGGVQAPEQGAVLVPVQ